MKFITLLSVSLLFSCIVVAQSKSYKNEIGFQTDNDGFLGHGQDRYYTAGNFLYFDHALNLTDTNRVANKVLGFEIGQKIYTAQSGLVLNPKFIDRPFAGYLYIGSSLNVLYKNESNLKLDAQAGFVGPHAYGKETQDLIHKTFGFYTPDGWEYQVQNDFELNLSAQYNALLFRIDNIDMSFNSYINAGTGFTGAGGGATIRLGTLNPLYNSISTTSTVTASGKPAKNELFVYYKPLLNLVAYDATIQGSMFTSSTGQSEVVKSIAPVVFSQQIGGALVMGHWVINASATFQSHNTKTMVKTEQWGSISVLYRFH
ncbi:lipid A-modifier LpxR family protein [Mucilaginibacter sp. AW1-3]